MFGKRNLKGISNTIFVIGLLLAVVTSSSVSTIVALQFVKQGPQGLQGPQGVQGIQGPRGDQGEPGLGVEPGYLVAPAYDSGWVKTNSSITLNHDLGTTEVFVYLIGKDDLYDYGIHNVAYGNYMRWSNLTTSQITIWGSRSYASAYVRVMICKISEPPA